MNILKPLVASLVLMTAAAGTAWAQHGHYDRGHYHGHSNVYLDFGFGPFWGPGWYYPPPVYYPPTVVVQQPPVYIEQQQVPAAAPAPAPATSYWYYCPTSRRYYPYVNSCPAGWQLVSPTPPGP